MHILVSNDDGYRASGIAALAEALSLEYRVSVVAPERNCSGASNSLTLERGLRACRVNESTYYVDGTPTDTVHLALTGLLEDEPDMVVSGINAGANMGDDVLYSGTVAAAMEGRHLGLPSIAVSLDSYKPKHFDVAAKAVVVLLKDLTKTSFAANTILNINVPDVPWSEMQIDQYAFDKVNNSYYHLGRELRDRGWRILFLTSQPYVPLADAAGFFHYLESWLQH